MPTSVKILDIVPVTHNVRRYTLEKPEGFVFEPGQATEVSVDSEGWRDKKRPFTFTSLAEWDHLEFTIKSYFDHEGVTHRLWSLKPGDRLLLRDVWGTITYKDRHLHRRGRRRHPFIAILRRLHADHRLEGHRLIVSNRTAADIILREEFEAMKGLQILWTLTDDPNAERVEHQRIDEDFLRRYIHDISQHFYVCGPDQMVKDIRALLEGLGASAETLVWEK